MCDSIIWQPTETFCTLTTDSLTQHICLRKFWVCADGRVTRSWLTKRVVAIGEATCWLAAGTNIDGSLVGAVEVGGDWWLLREWEIRLAFCDDLWFVLLCLVDDGLRKVLVVVCSNPIQ